MSVVIRQITRPPKDIVEEFKKLSAATVHEAMGKNTANAMDPAIKPVGPGMKVAGPAVTVLCFPADNIMVHKALVVAQEGDVLVINAHGLPGVMWGAQLAYQAVLKDIAGVVVDGSVRDVAGLRKINFPCYARYITPLGSAKDTPGSINIPIQCGGVIVRPGEIIVGDDDGVVVVPQEEASVVLKKAKEREAREEEVRRILRDGRTSFEIYGFDKVFQQKNVKEILDEQM